MGCQDDREAGGVEKGSKHFFFEKKKQKTFIPVADAWGRYAAFEVEMRSRT
jgi:hypothetical protein